MYEVEKSPSRAGKSLKRALGLVDLIGYGVGCTVGAGIYSLIGSGAKIAGPAVLLSFVVGAVSCIFTGMAYSEFAAKVPVAGSAYTYAYTSFGELFAWIIGWNLTLEYAIASAVIARSWASYLCVFCENFGLHIPTWVNNIPLGGEDSVSLLSVVIIAACTAIMLTGAEKSSKFNVVFTCLNICVLAFVVIAGSFYVDPANWTCVDNTYVPYGTKGVLSGAGTVFFAYLGFDMVSSLAEEVVQPQRNMPLGITGSLLASALVYMSVTLVVTGMVPFTSLIDTKQHMAAPLAYAFQLHGQHWASSIVAAGSVFGLTTATFSGLMGQPRIFYRMAQDGLLFPQFAMVNSRSVPVFGVIFTGVITASIAAMTTLDILADAISIGTLLAFSIVDAGVIVIRFSGHRRFSKLPLPLVSTYVTFCLLAALSNEYAFPLPLTIACTVVAALSFGGLVLIAWRVSRDGGALSSGPGTTFRCPLVPLVPCVGIAINSVMMAGLKPTSWLRLAVWTAVGLLIYFGYGVWHSGLNFAAQSFAEEDALSSGLLSVVGGDLPHGDSDERSGGGGYGSCASENSVEATPPLMASSSS